MLNSNSKFSKTKNQTRKRPPKVPKIKKIYKEASNPKVFQNRPPKSGNSDSKYNFKIKKKQKLNSKVSKNQKNI